MILVVDRRDSVLRHDSGVLCLEREGGETRRAPINQLELVVVYGNPLAETAVWRKLAAAGVPTVLLPVRGRDGAAVLGNGLATQLPLRRLQHRRAAEPARALELARWILAQKLASYDLPLQPLRRRHGADEAACAGLLRQRDRTLAALATARSRDELMGLEGQLAHAWFALLAKRLAPAWGFTGRNRRPPQDPINALFSLGYTLLGAEVHQGVVAAGLDPSLGFLHQPVPGREAMVLDLTEPFRSAVDHFVLDWIAVDGPRQADYYYREADGCRLSKTARPGFFQAWASYRHHWPYAVRLDPSADWPASTLREQIRGQIERLRSAMKTPEAPS
ncbi:CRISPR-associated endonuclease Cas1 [Thioflavicoccus mobilis 8321]|uniref:CRISPR-associated endonuclease Cas1 n=1 Tax=Thioflavicoccus mobilis 8321 TaxID=765912 RepID=L0GT62_9GAMM|nr:CRISPR-associated endonuclease Cas1 [Thioflavicoccus mobilis]AGA89196.1 CRISPR-associated endonuclease Cas1 [Thioflavicoccus mobilis 8321]